MEKSLTLPPDLASEGGSTQRTTVSEDLNRRSSSWGWSFHSREPFFDLWCAQWIQEHQLWENNLPRWGEQCSKAPFFDLSTNWNCMNNVFLRAFVFNSSWSMEESPASILYTVKWGDSERGRGWVATGPSGQWKGPSPLINSLLDNGTVEVQDPWNGLLGKVALVRTFLCLCQLAKVWCLQPEGKWQVGLFVIFWQDIF